MIKSCFICSKIYDEDEDVVYIRHKDEKDAKMIKTISLKDRNYDLCLEHKRLMIFIKEFTDPNFDCSLM